MINILISILFICTAVKSCGEYVLRHCSETIDPTCPVPSGYCEQFCALTINKCLNKGLCTQGGTDECQENHVCVFDLVDGGGTQTGTCYPKVANGHACVSGSNLQCDTFAACLDGTCTFCLSENDEIKKKNGEVLLLRDVVIGDFIFDGESFTKVLAVEYGPLQNMLQFFMSNMTEKGQLQATMTGNHLLYDVNNELIAAKDIEIGDVIFQNYVVNKIGNVNQYSATPITFSGYLQVNGGVKVSSYPRNKEFALLVHNYLSIFRWVSDNINERVTGKIVEWIATDHHYYFAKLKQSGWDCSESVHFYFFAPLVIATVIVKRLYLPILIGIIATVVMKGKRERI